MAVGYSLFYYLLLIALIAKGPVQDTIGSSHQTFSPPPSVAILKSFKQSNSLDTTDLACRTLLPVEVNMWVKHSETVTENRKRGSKRAAATRKVQQQLTETGNCKGHNDDDGTINDEGYCGVCEIIYEEETDEIEKWIACDVCGMWYHWECTSIVEEPESYICVKCE